jgi:hypothetical protein
LGHDHRTRDRGIGRRREPLAAGPLTIDEGAEQRGWRRPGLTTLTIVYR